MLVNSPLLFINKSIFIARTLIGLPLYLLISSLKQNLNIGFIITYLKIGGLKVQLIFNKNIIKLGDNKEYIKKAINIMVILYTK